MFPLLKFTREQVDDYFAKVTPQMVDGSLAKDRHDWFDLLNLLSPAAYSRLDAMRRKARLARIRYYGKTVSVYAPLYIGNTCVNSCRYCDFRAQHTGTVRRNLTMDEIRVEAEAIRRTGIDNLLIVAGEDPRVNSVAHFCEVGAMLKKTFSNLSLEVAPQSEDGYRQMFEAGYESLTCFQETYDRERYGYFHPAGPKSRYEWRLWTQLRAGRAGFRTLGCAFLLGLCPWRAEAASLGAHAIYLMKECYASKIQFAFPRFCRVAGGFVPPHEVSERDVDLMMLAFRIVFPQCCMTVSTREAPAFRDYIVQYAADNMSAGSRVTPGGYAVLGRERAADVAQFTLTDRRTPAEVFAAIKANGQEVVFKNWDNRI
ncbi:MAG: radical SAM protein [Kiritimatiellia bacterium]